MPLIINDEYPKKLFREDGKRLDGREKHELRPIKMEVGVIDNADGSAYLEWGNNKIFAAVYGPREVHPHHLAKPDKEVAFNLIFLIIALIVAKEPLIFLKSCNKNSEMSVLKKIRLKATSLSGFAKFF